VGRGISSDWQGRPLKGLRAARSTPWQPETIFPTPRRHPETDSFY